MKLIEKTLEPNSPTITNLPTLDLLGLVDIYRFTRNHGTSGDPTKFLLIEPRDKDKKLPALNFEKSSTGRLSIFIY